MLRQPLADVAGSRIICTATFDNSKSNLNNPDPSKTVRWGDQTWEEMMIGYYHYAVPVGEPTGLEDDSALAAVGRSLNRMEIYNRIDQDNDGRLAHEDAPADIQSTFKQLDANSDGVLTRKEVALSE